MSPLTTQTQLTGVEMFAAVKNTLQRISPSSTETYISVRGSGEVTPKHNHTFRVVFSLLYSGEVRYSPWLFDMWFPSLVFNDGLLLVLSAAAPGKHVASIWELCALFKGAAGWVRAIIKQEEICLFLPFAINVQLLK